MDNALAPAPAPMRRDEPVRTNSAQARRPEPASAHAATRADAVSSRRTSSAVRKPAATAAGQPEDTDADGQSASRAGDRQEEAAVADVPPAAPEDRPQNAGAAAAGEDAPTDEPAAETEVTDPVASAAIADVLELCGEPVEGEGAGDTAQRTEVAAGNSAAPAKGDAAVKAAGAHGQTRAGGTGTPIPAHAQAGQTARARAEITAAPDETLGELVQEAVHAAHDETTTPMTEAARAATSVVESPTSPEAQAKTQAQAKTVDAAVVFADKVSEAETVVRVEPATGADVSDAGAEKQPPPRTATPAPDAQTVAAATAPSEGVRFSVNVAAGNAAYASAAPRHEEVVLPQIVQSIRVHAAQGSSEARVQLKPEHLGVLNITLKVEQGNVTATIQADVAAVRQWIQSHESSLRQALSEQGLQLTRLIVHPDGEQAKEDEREDGQPRRQPRRRSWRDEDVTFEVLV